MDHLEMIDVYKALMAAAAGLILGLERELKDKAAGIKTITIICLGAALFSIISYKVGGTEDTRIASYIVGGVGFLGAGVIFKDGFTVTGLTTAGVIWLAAAIGTSIGYNEFYMAGVFLAIALFIIFATPVLTNFFLSKKQTRLLQFEIYKKYLNQKEGIYNDIRQQGVLVEEKKIELKEGSIFITTEIVIRDKKTEWLQNYLVNSEIIQSFSL